MTGTTTGSRTSGVGATQTPPGGGQDTIKDTAQSAADRARQTGSELTSKASDQVSGAAHKLADRAGERKEELTSTARTVQDKMRQFADSVGQEQPQLGSALEQVADSAGRLIEYVERTPVEEMTQDLGDQMRRHPMLFAGGMFAAGFALTRVLKPVNGSMLPSGSASQQPRSRELASTAPTRSLPAASPIDGGMH